MPRTELQAKRLSRSGGERACWPPERTTRPSTGCREAPKQMEYEAKARSKRRQAMIIPAVAPVKMNDFARKGLLQLAAWP